MVLMELGKQEFKLIIILALLAVSSVSINWTMKRSVLANSIELPTQYPLVYVYPGMVRAEVNETFTVSVIVYNLTDAPATDPDNPQTTVPLGNLYGFDIQLSWDPNIIKYVNHTITAPVETYPEPVPPSPYPGILHGYGTNNQSVFEVMNIVDESGNLPGAVDPKVKAWFAYTTMLPATPFNGNGTILTMTFQLIKAGESPIEIVHCTLADKNGDQIACGSSGTWLNPPRNGVCRSAGVPVADFKHWPDIGVTNKTVIFEAIITENTSEIATYAWDFGDGTEQNTTQPTVTYNYTNAGFYTVSLYVEDSSSPPVKSATIQKQIQIVNSRNLKAVAISLTPFLSIRPNNTLTITGILKNLGEASENCTLKVYYNTTNVDLEDISTASWFNFDNQSLTILSGGEKTVTFTFNSSNLPVAEAYYYFMLNATGIPAGYEADITDNAALSTPILYTEQIIHVPTIVSLNLGYDLAGKIVSPVIEGEVVTIKVEVRNDGNEKAVYNMSLYVNNALVVTNQTSELLPGNVESLTWKQSLAAGHYNMTVEAKISNVESNNTAWLDVVKTPNLVITYTPETPKVNQEVTLNASGSIHQDPNGNITIWTWKIFAPGLDPSVATPTRTITGSVATFNFTSAGNWTVVLEVQDNYGLNYNSKRAGTSAYRKQITLTILGEEAPPSAPPFPMEMVVAIIVIVIVVAVAVVIAMRKRRQTKV